jgi:hypothetical protein
VFENFSCHNLVHTLVVGYKSYFLILQASLLHLYETIPSTFNFQNISSDPLPQTPPSPSVTAAGNLEDMFKQWSHPPAYNHSKSPASAPVKGKGVKRPLDSTRKEGSGKSKCKSHM